MKKYISPSISFVDLRIEERISSILCDGRCDHDIINDTGNILYRYQTYS